MSDDATPAQQKPPPVDRMALLWRRINEHKIVQWSVAYVALAYAIQHAVVLTSDAFEWPHIVQPISMLLLGFGAPVVMTLAWYHGQKASRRISGPELTIITLLLVTSSLLFYVFVKPAGEASAPPSAAQRSAPTPAGISLAVLPFVNLSSDKEQEFFSDGMTEEITSALAKISGLNVVARTSAFQFKGANKDMRAIGQALGASHLIEGSVRKDGNQIRITAQLIKADDGTHLWTESYDRELKGVFAIQEEIATAIAASLRVPLGLKEGQSLVSNRTIDTDSYQDYLRAKALVRGRGPLEPGGPLTQATALLQHVVERNPDYAPAWSLLGLAYSLIPPFTSAGGNGLIDQFRPIAQDVYSKAEAAAQQATRLDPGNADGYVVLGLQRFLRGDLVEAEDLFQRAFSLDPTNPDALHQYGGVLAVAGRLKAALPVRLRLQAQEPLVPIFSQITAVLLWDMGRSEEALTMLKPLSPSPYGRLWLAMVYASTARYQEAANALQEVPPGFLAPEALKEAVRLLRTAPAKPDSVQPSLSRGFLGFVYLFVGVPDRGIDYLENFADTGYPFLGNGISQFWGPAYAPARHTQRFKNFARKAGLVAYWRARGWSDLCHPTTGDDFACE
jgi:TolB-like protein/Flp pilus assembly protein TadD